MLAFALPPELARHVNELEDELAAFTAEARDKWESRSERWRESAAGEAAGAWLDTLDHLGETLGYLDKKATSK